MEKTLKLEQKEMIMNAITSIDSKSILRCCKSLTESPIENSIKGTDNDALWHLLHNLLECRNQVFEYLLCDLEIDSLMAEQLL